MEGMLNYFVPEDGDSSDHLNVVPLPRVDQLRLQHVKKSFPLPGDFHFRFKTAFEGTYVWLDVVNDADPVPDFNGLSAARELNRPPERTETPKVQVEAPDLIETSEPPPSPTKREEPQAVQKTFNNDLVGLVGEAVRVSTVMADPVPSPTPQAPSAPSPVPPVWFLFCVCLGYFLQKSPAPPQAARDPFDVFAGNSTAPMRPTPISATMSANNAPRGMSPTTMGNHGGAFGAQGGLTPWALAAPRRWLLEVLQG
ncbi:Ubiquitin-related domain [Phytophthora cactorum]|nr:Ubiquitin-related domain [Phytophthora cactorum]